MSQNDYTTEDVRIAFVKWFTDDRDGFPGTTEEVLAAQAGFEKWHSAELRNAKAEVLREVSDRFGTGDWVGVFLHAANSPNGEDDVELVRAIQAYVEVCADGLESSS